MKKFLLVVAAASVLTAGAFAQDKKVSCDLQLQIGVNGTERIISYKNVNNADININSAGLYFGLTNYNLFNLNPVFSCGFMDSFASTFGGTTNKTFGGVKYSSYNSNGTAYDETTPCFDTGMLIGPAIGLTLGKVAKFQIGAGFAWDFVEADILATNQSTSSSSMTSLVTTNELGY